MVQPNQSAAVFSTMFPSLASCFEINWYAVYTRARHEKKIADHLEQRSIEHFLPLYSSVRRWKDRRIKLQLPLFPSYVFVRIPLLDHIRVLQLPGAVRFVSFNGKPTALPEGDIFALRRGLTEGVRAEPHPYLEAGSRIRVKSGPLRGLSGMLVRDKENSRIVISVHSITRSIICEVSLSDLEIEPPSAPTVEAFAV